MKDFAATGAKVVLAARNAQNLERDAQEILTSGGDALAVPCDVSVYEQVLRLADRAAAEFGRIDTWIHSAAVSMSGTSDKPRSNTSAASWR